MKPECGEVQPALAEFMAAQLAPEERRVVEEHVVACAACRGVVDEERAVRGAFARAKGAQPSAALVAKRLGAILAARPKVAWRWRKWMALPAAAGVIVALGVVGSAVQPARKPAAAETSFANRVRAGHTASSGLDKPYEEGGTGWTYQSLNTPMTWASAPSWYWPSTDGTFATRGSPLTWSAGAPVNVNAATVDVVRSHVSQTDSRMLLDDDSTGAYVGRHAASQDRKVVRTAAATFEVADVAPAHERIRQLALNNGGYIFGAALQRPPKGPATMVLTVRLPAEQFDAFQRGIDGLGKLLALDVRSDDITTQYVDLEARLRTAQVHEERLQALLARETNNVDDLLKVEQQLNGVRERIEQMQSQQRTWDKLTALATFHVTLAEPRPEEEEEAEEEQGYWLPVADAWEAGKNGLAYLVAGVVFILPIAGPLAILATPLVWAWRRRRAAGGAGSQA